MSNNNILEIIFSIILLFLAFLHFRYFIRKKLVLRFVYLHIWVVLITFGAGSFVHVIFSDPKPNWASESILIVNGNIIFYIIGLFSTLLLFKNRKLNNEFNFKTELINIIKKIKVNNLILIYILALVVPFIISIYYEVAGYGSGTLEKMLAIPYPVTVLLSVLRVIAGSSLFFVLFMILNKKKSNLLYFLIIIILIMNFQSRAFYINLLYVIVLIQIILKIFNIKKFLLGSIALLILIFLLFPIVTQFRASSQANYSDSNQSLIEAYSESYTNLTNDDFITYRDRSFLNLIDRIYILKFNYLISEKLSNKNYLNGEVLLNSLGEVLPRAVNPVKLKTKVASEQLIQLRLGMIQKDAASNPVAYGMADFGFLGSFLYGLILGFIFKTIELFFIKYRIKYSIFAFLSFGAGLVLVFWVEAAFTLYLSTIRELLILLLIVIVLKSIGVNFNRTQSNVPISK